jgi:undecaprenyl-diphosphatase
LVVLRKENPIGHEVNIRKGFLIGLFQSLALLPGISRSGSTISGSMILGINREEAAKFSFLLSIPIVVAAGVFQLLKSYTEITAISADKILVGFVVSFSSGVLAIKFLLKFVKSHSLYPFIVYRILLAVILLSVYFIR